MKKISVKLILLGMMLCAFLSINAVTEVLYESTQINIPGGILNATSWPALNDGLILIDDITVPESGWTISSVANYFSPLGSPTSDSAFIYVYSKSEGDVPPMPFGVKVPVTMQMETFTDSTNAETREVSKIEASGLNISLNAGEYWIGLSPITGEYANCWMAWGSYTSNGERPKCYDMYYQNWVGLAFWTGPDQMLKVMGSVNTPVNDATVANKSFLLNNNYPNPFNPSTTISFSLKNSSSVKLEVFNSKGQLVNTLCDHALTTGNYNYTWNGTDNSGRKVTSGVYFYRLKADNQSTMKKMLMLK